MLWDLFGLCCCVNSAFQPSIIAANIVSTLRQQGGSTPEKRVRSRRRQTAQACCDVELKPSRSAGLGGHVTRFRVRGRRRRRVSGGTASSSGCEPLPIRAAAILPSLESARWRGVEGFLGAAVGRIPGSGYGLRGAYRHRPPMAIILPPNLEAVAGRKPTGETCPLWVYVSGPESPTFWPVRRENCIRTAEEQAAMSGKCSSSAKPNSSFGCARAA